MLGRSAALFTSTSTAPNCFIAASAMRLQSSGSPTSPITTSVLAPSLPASWATFSQAARSLEPLSTTSKPSSARPSTQARPILRPAPVIKAVLRDAIFYSPGPFHSPRRHVDSKTIPLGQRPARVWTGGSGEAIVLLHGGWAGAEAYWSTVADELERSHLVVAPELPGIGMPASCCRASAPMPRGSTGCSARLRSTAPRSSAIRWAPPSPGVLPRNIPNAAAAWSW